MNTVKRYVARPVEVDAVEWVGRLDDLPLSWRTTGAFDIDPDNDELRIQTNQGPAHAGIGDFAVHGTAGEFYPVPRAIFTFKYEEVAA